MVSKKVVYGLVAVGAVVAVVGGFYYYKYKKAQPAAATPPPAVKPTPEPMPSPARPATGFDGEKTRGNYTQNNEAVNPQVGIVQAHAAIPERRTMHRDASHR